MVVAVSPKRKRLAPQTVSTDVSSLMSENQKLREALATVKEDNKRLREASNASNDSNEGKKRPKRSP
jgi:hypothetical protein